MKLKQIFLGVFITISLLITLPTDAQIKQAVDYVHPLIGTPEAGFKEGIDGGGTVPCVGPPFAMTNFVAQVSEK